MGETAQRAVFRPSGEGQTNRAFDLPRLFLIRADAVGGSFSHWIEEVPAGAGPPMHVHHRERELFRVVAGQFRFWCAGEVRDMIEGDTALIPMGAPHTFKNTGASTGQLLITLTPGAGEGFFFEVEANALHPSRDMPRIVEIAARYGLTFVGPPPE
ncbi:MAG TPA: cupin domain-containing protein [Microvirga sp.]|jgi:mannose-6-phosphate isomerase-like protein (cupin superfamily)|nr:cupin domain-containing protein [Microvirga sp.]